MLDFATRRPLSPSRASSQYVQVSVALFDEIFPTLKTLGEVQVLLYVIRHTCGWRKESDTIALSQFEFGVQNRRTGDYLDHGTGLSRETIINAIRRLEAAGILLVERPTTRGGRNDSARYRLNLAGLSDDSDPEEASVGLDSKPESPASTSISRPDFARVRGRTLPEFEVKESDPQKIRQKITTKESPEPHLPIAQAHPTPPPGRPPDPAAAEPAADEGPAFEQLADDERATLSTLGNRLQRWHLGRWDHLREDLATYAAAHRLSALQLQRLIDLASQDDRDKPRSLDELLTRCDLLGPGLFRAWRGVSRAAA